MLCGTSLQLDLLGEQGVCIAGLHHGCITAASLLHHSYSHGGNCALCLYRSCTTHVCSEPMQILLLLSVAVTAAGVEGNPGVCIS